MVATHSGKFASRGLPGLAGSGRVWLRHGLRIIKLRCPAPGPPSISRVFHLDELVMAMTSRLGSLFHGATIQQTQGCLALLRRALKADVKYTKTRRVFHLGKLVMATGMILWHDQAARFVISRRRHNTATANSGLLDTASLLARPGPGPSTT